MKDPYARKGIAPWKKWTISIVCIAVVAAALWLFNLLAWAKLPSPLPCFGEEDTVEVVEVPVTETEAE